MSSEEMRGESEIRCIRTIPRTIHAAATAAREATLREDEKQRSNTVSENKARSTQSTSNSKATHNINIQPPTTAPRRTQQSSEQQAHEANPESSCGKLLHLASCILTLTCWSCCCVHAAAPQETKKQKPPTPYTEPLACATNLPTYQHSPPRYFLGVTCSLALQ